MSRFNRARHSGDREIQPLLEAMPERGEWKWATRDSDITGSRVTFNRKGVSVLQAPLRNAPCPNCGVNHHSHARLRASVQAQFTPEKPRTGFTRKGQRIEVPLDSLMVSEEMRLNQMAAQIQRDSAMGDEASFAHLCPEAVIDQMIEALDNKDYLTAFDAAVMGNSMGAAARHKIWEARSNYLRKVRGERKHARDAGDQTTETSKSYETELIEHMNSAIYNVSSEVENQLRIRNGKAASWRKVQEIAIYMDEVRQALKDIAEITNDQLAQDLKKLADQMNRQKQEEWKRQVAEAEQAAGDKAQSERDFGNIKKAMKTRHLEGGMKETMTKKFGDGNRTTAEMMEDGNLDTSTVQWAKMEITEPRLVKSLPKYKLDKGRRATPEGDIPRYMNRWGVDKAIFQAKRRKFGGAVLIDISGSMSLTQQQIMDIIEAAPATVIATYCGAGDRGELKIVARDGKMVDPAQLKRKYGGNQIDYPALEWLGQQQASVKIWVSDGQVVSTSHGFSEMSWEACERLLKKYRITRVDNATHAHEVFIGKRKLAR